MQELFKEGVRGDLDFQGAEGRGVPRQSREAGESDGKRGVSSKTLNPGDTKEEGSRYCSVMYSTVRNLLV